MLCVVADGTLIFRVLILLKSGRKSGVAVQNYKSSTARFGYHDSYLLQNRTRSYNLHSRIDFVMSVLTEEQRQDSLDSLQW